MFRSPHLLCTNENQKECTHSFVLIMPLYLGKILCLAAVLMSQQKKTQQKVRILSSTLPFDSLGCTTPKSSEKTGKQNTKFAKTRRASIFCGCPTERMKCNQTIRNVADLLKPHAFLTTILPINPSNFSNFFSSTTSSVNGNFHRSNQFTT